MGAEQSHVRTGPMQSRRWMSRRAVLDKLERDMERVASDLWYTARDLGRESQLNPMNGAGDEEFDEEEKTERRVKELTLQFMALEKKCRDVRVRRLRAQGKRVKVVGVDDPVDEDVMDIETEEDVGPVTIVNVSTHTEQFNFNPYAAKTIAELDQLEDRLMRRFMVLWAAARYRVLNEDEEDDMENYRTTLQHVRVRRDQLWRVTKPGMEGYPPHGDPDYADYHE